MSILVVSLCAELVRRDLDLRRDWERARAASPRVSSGRGSTALDWRTGTRRGEAEAEIVFPASVS